MGMQKGGARRNATVAGVLLWLLPCTCSAASGASGDDAHYLSRSSEAINDLVGHFWLGDTANGHIVATWNGLVASAQPNGRLPDARGGTWEAGTLANVLYGYYEITHSEDAAQRLRSEWRYIKAAYSRNDLTACGHSSHANFASDDAGWNARFFLQLYEVAGDDLALDYAKAAVECAFSRWQDQRFGGGLWYSDERKTKSLYQAALALDAFSIFERTDDRRFLSYAESSYEWIEKTLLRSDGLYWCDVTEAGPLGKERPEDIHLAGSVTFLAGNMVMALLHAHLFKLNGQEDYRQRAIRTTQGILAKLVDRQGLLLDDRDAWTNGTFVQQWVQEALPVVGEIPAHQGADVIKRTADAIFEKDRTPDGYYGGDWGGPADPAKAAWAKHRTVPQQITTSSNAVAVILAAAALMPH
jgi:hypothetical protein